MKTIIHNEILSQLHLKFCGKNLDAADIAFICMLQKANEIRSKRLFNRFHGE